MQTQTWADLFQIQPLASKIITNSIKRNRISHAYLFQGPRGSQKKMFAIHFAMTLFCKKRQVLDPCYECPNCKRIYSRNFPDVYWIEPDGQSIKNEQIKALRNEFVHTGVESAKKVYIIDRAETLTINATNRILKFLEEPDTDLVAILLTDNGQKILPTIRSRCQLIDFRSLDERTFQEVLLKQKDLSLNEREAILLSALTKDLDEALELHESKKVYELKEIIIELIYLLITKRKERYLYIHEKWLPQMKERNDFVQSLDLLLLAVRDILTVKLTNMSNTSFFHREDAFLKRSVTQFSQEQLLNKIENILEAKRKIESNVHPTLVMEQLVLKL